MNIATLATLIASVSGEASADDRFARIDYDKGKARALQIATVSYESSYLDDGVKVDLVGAVHIGDRAYYAELNDRFEQYDVLLYELVAPEGTTPVADAERRPGMLSGTQLAMTQALGLSYQLDEIDYTKANFVHADLSPDELSASMDERGESLYVYFWRLFYASINEASRDPLGLRDWRMVAAMLDEDQDNALKAAFAHEMTRVDLVRNAIDGESGSAIIESRNGRALEVLRGQLDAGAERVGIFYGVAHMSDFDKRLREDFGFEPVETTWIDAWDLINGNPPAP